MAQDWESWYGECSRNGRWRTAAAGADGHVIEVALTFGRTTPARFPAVRRLVRWLPGLCDGLLVDCDLAYRPESRLLVALARLVARMR